jgi:hypothetical protein
MALESCSRFPLSKPASTNKKDTIMIKIKPSRNLAARSRTGWFSARLISSALLVMRVTQAADIPAANTPSAIPWNQIGAKAGANYKGDGLAVTPTESGASLHCVFQRLDGDTTSEGLWLRSPPPTSSVSTAPSYHRKTQVLKPVSYEI